MRTVPRFIRLVAILLIGVGASVACAPAPTAAPGPVDPLVGRWEVTYGAPATVEFALDQGVYTLKAVSPVVVTNSSCSLPAGTVLGTFTASGNAYVGQHGLWWTTTCAFAYSTAARLTGNTDGTLSMVVSGFTHRLVRR